MIPVPRIQLADIRAARDRIEGAAVRTPLIELTDVPGAGRSIWLKLECLQPIGSFKIRGATNAMELVGRDRLSSGVYTASAGNMAQGVALAAKRMDVDCRVIVPDSAPAAKLDAIRRLGATLRPLPYDEWWEVLRDHGHPDERGHFVHPVSDPAVIAGNGTVGLEIVEDLPDVHAVFVPYGGGGLSCGIASAVKAIRPSTKVFASEVETAAPFAASLAADRPSTVERTASFVDGIGGNSVLDEMWPLASALLDGSQVTTIDAICDAIRMLARSAHVIAEGAGASSVAAAIAWADSIAGTAEGGAPIVAVVSGGNIDPQVLAGILEGGSPDGRSSVATRTSG